MTDGFVDPTVIETEEYLKAADLRNQVCLIHPKSAASEPGTKPDSDGVIRPWEYVVCDVATLDRSGIVQYSNDVRISWRRPRLALLTQLGDIVGGKFSQAEGSAAVELLALTGTAREVAANSADEFRHRIAGQTSTDALPADTASDGFADTNEEPF